MLVKTIVDVFKDAFEDKKFAYALRKKNEGCRKVWW